MKGNNHLSKLALALCAALPATVMASQTTPVQGLHDHSSSFVALQNATVVTEPGKQLKNATLVIRNGKIESILTNNQAPAGARVVDASGHTIYPGFIDAYSDYGLPKTNGGERAPYRSQPPQYNNKREGGNAANDAIHAQVDWVDSFATSSKDAKSYIEQGFTAVQSARLDGIFQGQATTVSLADTITNNAVYNAKARHFGSFDKGSSKQQYPSSLMGSIALIRQTLSDAAWYEDAAGKQAYNGPVEYNAALAELAPIEQEGMVFKVSDDKDLLRAYDVFSGFKVPVTFVGSGFEYARLDAIKATKAPVILPLNFPAAPEVKGVDDDLDVSLADLRHWERAPGNAAALAQADIDFSFTLHQLKKASDFWPNLRKAVAHGLSSDKALAALTTVPAQIAGVSDKAGKLAAGYMADFVVVEGDLFVDGTIKSVWLQGQEVELEPLQQADFAGNLTLNLADSEVSLELKDGKRPSGKLKVGDESVALKDLRRTESTLEFVVNTALLDQAGAWRIRLDQTAADSFTGVAIAPNGSSLPISANRAAAAEPAAEKATTTQANYVSRLTFPNVAYGLDALPERQNVHIKNATVWTADEAGVLENTDVLIRNGEFYKIGKDLATPSGYTLIDGTGKHVTPGIIDEHSHIAIEGGVNEGSEAITAEVRIGDVVNPDDIHIYRSLAGGTTMAQLLHGSANPMGGQAQVIKLRWGATANDIKFDAAPPSIKFALGENVKQSNWGSAYTVRYPQTRMGVEAVMRDGFIAAREYQQRRDAYNKLSRKEKARTAPPRPDYRLETLLEILNKERFVHAHSYVQSEILMLLRLAEEFNFTLTTFTHILEGYKVASEMAKHGASASTFADWWAFKFEVYDAIPYNACLMADKGVLTSINSDSNDLQRRLNTEAAKSVTYCGMSEHEALQMVTLNPAKQLKIDQHVGSIKTGKHADFVIWSGHPLSAYSHPEQTWINARKYFDREYDQQLRAQLQQEKQGLIQKVLGATDEERQGSANGYKPQQPTWHCDDNHDVWSDAYTAHGEHIHINHSHTQAE
ncbi:amidohydrolase family protein [Pseudidiomarina tainanensis]|uniref:Imidazolonepropionase-like amidohydrolase n=1 Tax=Pseudidiomarina tainanensis TaxID=502365 RepID=A0A368US36_9GAMM|nr:amidohydrolase family protein [Pseudidiomarina tainanensis]RCW30935.1 imidazolonepropionase-like amidohydrolase [Pseudidiomarina tainanensis]